MAVQKPVPPGPSQPSDKVRPAIFVSRRVVVWACFMALSPEQKKLGSFPGENPELKKIGALLIAC
jgi:hypothetical protein